MELWIRSQDRKLLEKAYMIKIGTVEETQVIIVNNDYVYGEYKTKERALKVLTEIEAILLFKKLEAVNGSCIINVDNNIAVYEMPKE